jgi:hypothetical protein
MQASRVLYCLYISNNHVTSLNQTKKFHYRREHGRFGRGSDKSEICLYLEYKRYVFFVGKLNFRFFYICLLLEKLVNEKYFSVEEKFGLVF